MTDELRPLATDPADEPNPPTSREELWERIRLTSRDEFILKEMVRLGFWDAKQGKGKAPAKLIQDIGRLEREVAELAGEKSRLEDRARLLKEIRQRRMAEAKKKREETKARREQERQERAAAWRETQKTEVVYLGEGVSAGLGYGEHDERRQGDDGRLRAHGLPQIGGADELAEAMGIRLGELRFLAFQRKVAETNHYRRFLVPKKTGGERLISAPMPRLKAAQRWVLENVLEKVPVHDAAHGFVKDRNIVTNARLHCGQDVVINLDLKDFFPTVTYRRVKGLFRSLGYSEEIATVLGLICTEPEITEIELDGVTRFVQRGPRRLPQGSPASPALTNLICRRLDRRLQGLAESLGFVYSRYADDLTFSAKDGAGAETGDLSRRVGKVLRACRGIVEHEDFLVHPGKTRIMHKGSRQEVTGLTVNEKPNLDRKTRRRLRAVLFQLEKDGPDGKFWPGVGSDAAPGKLLQSLLGYAAFTQMVDLDEGRELVRRLRAVMQETGVQLPPAPTYPEKVPSWKQKDAAQDSEDLPPAEDDTRAGDEDHSEAQGKKSLWQRLKFW